MESLKTCPFCGSDDIGVKDNILEYKMGQGCPCSSIRRVWAYCRRCECEGRKTTIESVYDSEIIAAAAEAWNRREEKKDEILEAAGMDDKQSFKKVMKSATDIICDVCEDICNNYCKYRGTEDEDLVCDQIREKGSCPLDRLF